MTLKIDKGEIHIYDIESIELKPLRGDDRNYVDIIIKAETETIMISCYGKTKQEITIIQKT